ALNRGQSVFIHPGGSRLRTNRIRSRRMKQTLNAEHPMSNAGPNEKRMSRGLTTERIAELSPRFKARMAGVCYVLGSLTSVFGQMVVLGMLVVPASATATAANILSHESLFRLGFVASLMTV